MTRNSPNEELPIQPVQRTEIPESPGELPSQPNGSPSQGSEPGSDPGKIRSHWVAHWFGCGLLPKAPGTFGSLGAIPLHLAFTHMGPIPHALAVLGLTGLGFYASQRAAEAVGDSDPSAVVIDEVAGTLIACWFIRDRGPLAILLAFALFRLFDITKPWLIDKAQHVGPPGVSIMLDDILAGLVAGVISFYAAFWF